MRMTERAGFSLRIRWIPVNEILHRGVGEDRRNVPGGVVDIHPGKGCDLIFRRLDAVGVGSVDGGAFLLGVLLGEHLIIIVVLGHGAQRFAAVDDIAE